MQFLSRNFYVLSLIGLWRPIEWTGWKARLYDLYTVFVAFANYSFLFSGMMDVEFTNIDIAAFIDNVSLLLSLVTIRQKISCAVFNRKQIIKITETLQNPPFKPQDDEERSIFQRYDGFTKFVLLYYPILFTIAITWYSMGHMFLMSPPNVLPYTGWFPYNYSTTLLYWPTAQYQLYAVFSAATVNLGFDPLLPCFICHICGQIQMLKHRFQLMIDTLEQVHVKSASSHSQEDIILERNLIADWVTYHVKIIDLVKFINSTWVTVIFVQYVASGLILCTVAYVLAHTPPLSMNFAGNLCYFIAMTFQIFFQCMSANIITIEFSDLNESLYESKLVNLSNNFRKSLVIILSKTLTPIIFSSGYFISLSLESFTKVVKLAYTIFNVLE